MTPCLGETNKIVKSIRCINDAISTYFTAFVEMFTAEVFRAVEEEGQSLILVFL